MRELKDLLSFLLSRWLKLHKFHAIEHCAPGQVCSAAEKKAKKLLSWHQRSTQKSCLRMKFAYKLLSDTTEPQLPWISWIKQQHLSSLPQIASCPKPSFLTKAIQTQLPKLLDITSVISNNGQKTLFWHDTWPINKPLAKAFPSLYSHSTNTHILVVHIML